MSRTVCPGPNSNHTDKMTTVSIRCKTQGFLSDPSQSSRMTMATPAQKRLLVKLLIWFALVLSCYQVLHQWFLAGIGIPDIEIDKETGQTRIRRQPHRMRKFDKIKGKHVPTNLRDAFDGIMEGYLSLINLQIPTVGLKRVGDKHYSGVMATFCHLTWKVQQEDPSKVPMFKDLREQSSLCQGTLHTVDFYEISRKAVEFDLKNHTFAATDKEMHSTPPTAVVFHETRCGSTLISNMLAAFDPERTRVYSESPPPLAALKACTDRQCDPGAHEKLISDVFYIMGRTTLPTSPTYVFYKIQSIGVHEIEAFGKAMPNTPWMFAYRNSVEVMMSHFKNYQHGNPLSKGFMPVCLRKFGYQAQDQPSKLMQLLQETDRTLESLTQEEYCAAHLGSLARAATDFHTKYKPGQHARHWFINYDSLPYKLWETVIPQLTGVPLKDRQIERLKQLSHLYSKGRGPRAGQAWQEDSTLKMGTAPQSVKDAAQLFMRGVEDKMKTIHDP